MAARDQFDAQAQTRIRPSVSRNRPRHRARLTSPSERSPLERLTGLPAPSRFAPIKRITWVLGQDGPRGRAWFPLATAISRGKERQMFNKPLRVWHALVALVVVLAFAGTGTAIAVKKDGQPPAKITTTAGKYKYVETRTKDNIHRHQN